MNKQTEMVNCPSCGKTIPASTLVCPECGQLNIPVEMVTCASCGSSIAANALVCPQCGQPNFSTTFGSPSRLQESQPVEGNATLTGHKEPDPNLELPPPDLKSRKEVEPPNPHTKPVANIPPSPTVAQNPVARRPDGDIRALDAALTATPASPPGRPMTVAGREHSILVDHPYLHVSNQEQNNRPAESASYQGHPDSQSPEAQRDERHVRHVRNEPFYGYDSGAPRITPVVAPGVAFQRELFGYIGLLGMGHITNGHPVRGVALMIAWAIFLPLAIKGLIFDNAGCCLFLFVLAVPGLSGIWISSEVQRESQ